MKTNKTRERVLGFLKAKGLLFAPNIDPLPSVKLDALEVLEFALMHEPRVLEVLPAALIHFPKTFLHIEGLPKEFLNIVAMIKREGREGKDFKGICYQDMLRWAQKDLPDKRTVPVSELRVMKSFRFKKETLKILKKLAEKTDKTETQVVEDMIIELL